MHNILFFSSFTEQHSVVKIVREKYLKTSNFKDQAELESFLSELYVFLVDQMHVGLGQVLTLEDETPVPAPITTDEQLRHFAREAEVNENFELASKYYQEVSRSCLLFGVFYFSCTNCEVKTHVDNSVISEDLTLCVFYV